MKKKMQESAPPSPTTIIHHNHHTLTKQPPHLQPDDHFLSLSHTGIKTLQAYVHSCKHVYPL